MKVLGGLPFVDVYINNYGPFLFIVDSGATETILTLAIAKRLGLRVTGIGEGATTIVTLKVENGLYYEPFGACV